MTTILIEDLNIVKKTITSVGELKRIYDRLIQDRNMHVDLSTDILFNTTIALPESIIISKHDELAEEDIYRNDKSKKK